MTNNDNGPDPQQLAAGLSALAATLVTAAVAGGADPTHLYHELCAVSLAAAEVKFTDALVEAVADHYCG